MAGYVVERYGFATGSSLISQVVVDMLANGFKLVHKDGMDSNPVFNKAEAGDKYKVILEAGPTVDPLNADAVAVKQPWRICFDVQNSQQVLVHAGTPVTLPNNGIIPIIRELYEGKPTEGGGYQPVDIVGVLGAKLSQTQKPAAGANNTPDLSAPLNYITMPESPVSGFVANEELKTDGTYIGKGIMPGYKVVGNLNPDYRREFDGNGNLRAPTASNPYYLNDGSKKWAVDPEASINFGTGNGETINASNSADDVTKCFINRSKRLAGLESNSNPMSYRLVITERGIWLGVWEDVTTQEQSNYFNWFLIQRPVDRNTGQVLATGKCPVFCVNSVGNKAWQFTVREADIVRPSTRRIADEDAEDSECIINTNYQVALSEDGKYIITFPSRLNTSRYRYPHELDMIGVTSADVVSQNSDVAITVYGESSERVYRALHANQPKNTGMRILVLQNGGGLS